MAMALSRVPNFIHIEGMASSLQVTHAEHIEKSELGGDGKTTQTPFQVLYCTQGPDTLGPAF